MARYPIPLACVSIIMLLLYSFGYSFVVYFKTTTIL